MLGLILSIVCTVLTAVFLTFVLMLLFGFFEEF